MVPMQPALHERLGQGSCMTSDDIQFRPIEAIDCDAIAKIAALTPGFTVPSRYIVWMLASMHADLCWVAVARDNSVIGYTLGTMTSERDVSFSWQTAVLPTYRTHHLAAALVARATTAAKSIGITRARFTCTPEQADTLAGLVKAAKLGEIEASAPIPDAWGLGELEVWLKLQS